MLTDGVSSLTVPAVEQRLHVRVVAFIADNTKVRVGWVSAESTRIDNESRLELSVTSNLVAAVPLVAVLRAAHTTTVDLRRSVGNPEAIETEVPHRGGREEARATLVRVLDVSLTVVTLVEVRRVGNAADTTRI